MTCYRTTVQRSAKRGSSGLVNFIAAVAYHFCLALPTAFTQSGQSLLADPCMCACPYVGLTQVEAAERGRFSGWAAFPCPRHHQSALSARPCTRWGRVAIAAGNTAGTDTVSDEVLWKLFHTR